MFFLIKLLYLAMFKPFLILIAPFKLLAEVLGHSGRRRHHRHHSQRRIPQPLPPARALAPAPAAPGHHLRHYLASLLIASGADVKTVQARLRHASATTTLNTYSHLWPDKDEPTRAAVDAVLQDRADSLRTKAGLQ